MHGDITMANSKRKSSSSCPILSKQKRIENTCILHNPSISNESPFICFSSCKGEPSEKLNYLLDIRAKRLSQPLSSSYRMRDVCNQLPRSLDGLNLDVTGYHRQCYQSFVKNLNRLKNITDDDLSEPSSSKKHHSPRLQVTSSVRFPLDKCLFCELNEIRVRGKTQRPTRSFVFRKSRKPKWSKIANMAQVLGDTKLHRKVIGIDLVASKARYHDICYHRFFSDYQKLQYKNRESETKATSSNNCHISAYTVVKNYVITKVVEEHNITPLTVLREIYTSHLNEQGIQNIRYRTQKLKSRLEGDNDLKGHIQFAKVYISDRGSLSFWLVYSSCTTTDDAIASAYKLGTADNLTESALYLRQAILRAFKESTDLPWPPTADELHARAKEEIPNELKNFLRLVIGGSCAKNEEDERSKRLVYSIGEDLCRAITCGKWKLSKHVLLCLTIRHLYRSKLLTSILSRLGHCESYDFGLELETAIGKALEDTKCISPNIVCGEGNLVFHNEWDNFNKITTNVHGTNVVNFAAGIMIQEKDTNRALDRVRTLPLYDRSNQKRLSLETPETISQLTIYSRESPQFPDSADFTPPEGEVYSACLKVYYTWFLCRMISSNGKQAVPGFSGFISATGVPPVGKSTIEYYTLINQPITLYETVEELLRRSEEATREVGQKYTINTFDLGVCMKALPLIWKFPNKYKNHIVLPGPFHTCMNYIGMITNHKCRGSGYAEILLEAGLVTSGCLRSVLSGKAYAKALFCLKTVCEALERILFEVFVEETSIQISPGAILSLIESCSRKDLHSSFKDVSTRAILEQYCEYQDKVRNGYLGKTAKFWLSVIDHQHLVLMLIYAVKTKNRELLHVCNGNMAKLFFAYDGPNYSRYLSWFEAFLTNLKLTHPGALELIDKGAFAVARSSIPGSLCEVDKTMEETFMKFAKSSGGLSGLFQNFGSYQRWCRTTSTRAQYFERLKEMCDMVTDPETPQSDRHRELEKANIRKSEEAVTQTVSAIKSFLNPFRIPLPEDSENDRLYALHSGAPVSKEIEIDVMRAERVGENEKLDFVNQRLKTVDKSFFDPIKRQSLLTMEHTNKKVKLTSSQGKIIQYQEQRDLAFSLLVKSQLLPDPVDLEMLIRYSLSPVPHCLGTPDGFLAKTNKAAMLHYILQNDASATDVEYPPDSFFIQDGNALFHSLVNLPDTFGAICLQILNQMANKKNFVFSTDSYHNESIKAQERKRLGHCQKFIVDGPATRKPKDFSHFLANDMNKTQFCQLLLKVWSSDDAISRLQRCAISIVIVEGKAYKLTLEHDKVVVTQITSLDSDQEETDTRVVLYLKYAEKLGFKSAVVRTPDTDIFFILLFHVHGMAISIFLDVGNGKNRKLVNVNKLATNLGKDWCNALLGLHVFTGEDCTSAFKGKGKVTPLKILQKNPRFHKTFRELGISWIVEQNIIHELEAFTCLMYGYAREDSVNAVRGKMLKKMIGDDQSLNAKSKVDLVRLPPCQDALIPHIQRTNYRTACYRRASECTIQCPNPHDKGHGGLKSAAGEIVPVWSVGPFLPARLVDILADNDEEYDRNDRDIEEESDDSVDDCI